MCKTVFYDPTRLAYGLFLCKRGDVVGVLVKAAEAAHRHATLRFGLKMAGNELPWWG